MPPTVLLLAIGAVSDDACNPVGASCKEALFLGTTSKQWECNGQDGVFLDALLDQGNKAMDGASIVGERSAQRGDLPREGVGCDVHCP